MQTYTNRLADGLRNKRLDTDQLWQKRDNELKQRAEAAHKRLNGERKENMDEEG